jgi:hypothetical protein
MRQLLPLAVLFGCAAAFAQPAPQHLCSSDNFKRLQTLDGAWEQASSGAQNKFTDTIRVAASDCAVEQKLQGAAASPDQPIKAAPKAVQANAIVLESSEPLKNGKTVQHRFTISNLTAESRDWKHEISTDKGKTWSSAPQLRLARLKPAAKPAPQQPAATPGGEECPTTLAWAPLPAAWVRYLLASSCH